MYLDHTFARKTSAQQNHFTFWLKWVLRPNFQRIGSAKVVKKWSHPLELLTARYLALFVLHLWLLMLQIYLRLYDNPLPDSNGGLECNQGTAALDFSVLCILNFC